MGFNKFNKSRDNRGSGGRSFGSDSRSEGSFGGRDNRSSGGSDRFGAGRSFGGGEDRGSRSFGGGGRFGGHKQMFPATCGECGERCEVPFRPTGTHPVFCSNCFQDQSGASSSPSPRFAPKSFGASAPVSSASGITKAQFDTLNVKLDKILSLLSAVKTVTVPEVEAEVEEKPKTTFLAAKKLKKAAKKK